MEESRLLTDTVTELIREEAAEDLRRVLEAQPPEALKDLLEHTDASTRDAVFAALPSHLAGEVATLLDDTVREDLLEDVSAAQIAEMVADLEADEALPILEDADPATASEVLRELDRLDPEEAGELRELLGYEEDSAGRAMAFGAPAVPQDLTLGQAVDYLRRSADELGELQAVFVVDSRGRLLGYLPLDALLLRPPDEPVLEAMRRDVTFAYTYEDQEEAVARARHSHLPVVPVIDNRGVLRGQISQERLREIQEEETTEDVHRLAGLSEDESIHSPFLFSLGKRLPWLLVNLLTAFLAAGVVGAFRHTLEAVVAVAVLQSIVPGQGGNAGIQTLTLTVRALALGDLDWRNSRRVFMKELAVGLANGAAVGLFVGALVALWFRNGWLGAIIAVAMVLNMLAAAVAGFCIPLAFRAMRLDPAQASGVFVTTVTDVFGFLFFLGLATLLLPHLQGL